MKYNVYVDASGDNGLKFENGSTPCYCVAVLICSVEDEEHNKGILRDIKGTLHTSQGDEVKYSTLRRHKNAAAAHKLLGNAKGTLLFHNVFKTKTEKPIHTALCHAFQIIENLRNIVDPGLVDIIFIDQMKQTEMAFTASLLEEAATKEKGLIDLETKVNFVDSKRIKLVQLADFYAGAMRYLLEMYIQREGTFPCGVCRKKRNLCRGLKKKRPLVHWPEVKRFKHLIYREEIGIPLTGLITDPMELYKNLAFFDCL